MKLKDYFDAGVELVWYVDPQTQTAEVFTSQTQSTQVDRSQSLDGGSILPGFKPPLADVFGKIK